MEKGKVERADGLKEQQVKKTEKMEQYEKETGKYAIWRGVITEGFRKWEAGGTIYQRDKERISLYVSDKTKSKWKNYKR